MGSTTPVKKILKIQFELVVVSKFDFYFYALEESKMSSPFRLDPAFVAKYQKREPPFGFNGLGLMVYLRTYSRVKDDGAKEVWYETVERVVNGCYNMQKKHIETHGLGWSDEDGQKSACEMYDRIYNLKMCPPGRGLWIMGSELTEKRGLFAALNNCGFTSTASIETEGSKPFCFLADMSMMGCGVGYDCKGAGKITIHRPVPSSDVFIVPDTREGWVEALRLTLDSYFYPNKNRTVFDYSLVRPAGKFIKGFGGRASGSDPLRKLLDDISNDLDKHEGKPISITNIADIMNRIGCCVVAGNVRRSAELALGDHDSEEFINLKNYDVNPQRMEYGWASNNSIFAEIGMDYSKIADRIAKNGEPGILLLDNMRNYGRMNGVIDSADHRVGGANPCVSADTMVLTEQGLVAVSNLVGKQFNAVVNGRVYPSSTRGFWKTAEDQQLLKLQLDNGSYVRCTSNHQILTRGDKWVEAGKLATGAEVMISENCDFSWTGGEGTEIEGYMLGQIIGDGTFFTNGSGYDSAVIAMWLDPKYQDKLDYTPLRIVEEYLIQQNNRSDFKGFRLTRTYDNGHRDYRVSCKYLSNLAAKFGIIPIQKKVPEDGSVAFTTGLLRGFFDADGSVMGEQQKGISVRLCQSDLGRLEATQRLLLSLGIMCKVYKNRRLAGERQLPNGHGGSAMYNCKANHELIITNDSLFRFRDRIGFWDNDKRARLDLLLGQYKRRPNRSKFYSKVIDVTPDGCEDVYDATIPGISRFTANGIIVHNCVEQCLEPYELCCLSEVMLARHDSMDDFLRTLKFAYLYAKTVTLGKSHWSETNRILLRNRRIGTSVTGIAQFLAKHNTETMRNWLEEGYIEIRKYDKIYSDWLCIPQSIRCTSVKPSGTVSLLAGSTPGCHYPESRFYIRRVRVGADSELLPQLRKAGYDIEPDAYSAGTMVVSFPIDAGEGVRTTKDVCMWEQLALVALLQRCWSDNSVSATVTFDPVTEGSQIAHAMNYYQFSLKSVSFLPRLAVGAYKQMPYEAIDEDKYRRMASAIVKVNLSDNQEADGERGCDGTACMLR